MKVIMQDPPSSPHTDGGYTLYHDGQTIHREDGPAVIYRDGSGEFFLHGVQMLEKDYWELAPYFPMTFEEMRKHMAEENSKPSPSKEERERAML